MTIRQIREIRVPFLLAVCLLLPSLAFSQLHATRITLKTRSEYSLAITAIPGDTIYLRVATKKGHAIRSLIADDFLITRDDDTAEIISCTGSTNSPATDLAITFILDNSGSMFHSYDSLTGYLDGFLDSLGSGFTANAMAFDNIERKRTFDGTERENLYIASSGFTDEKRELKEFWHSYDSIRTDLTPLYETIVKGLLRISDRRKAGDSLRREVMLVITDGADNASSASIEQLSELAAAMPVSIYTVNFRSDPDGRLLWLSRKTHGDHYVAEDLKGLRETLEFLRTDISNSYKLVFRFPFRGASSGR